MLNIPSFIRLHPTPGPAPAFPNKFAKGTSPTVAPAQAGLASIGGFVHQFAATYATDAHTACYTVLHHTLPPGKSCRVNKASVGVVPDMELRFWGMVFDADFTDHSERWDAHPDLYPQVKAAMMDHLAAAGLPGAAVRQTRGGMHIYVQFDRAWDVKCKRGLEFWELAWAHIAAMLQPALDPFPAIQVDESVGDWTRFYRLPRVVRDRVPQVPSDLDECLANLRPQPLPSFTVHLSPKSYHTKDYGDTADVQVGEYELPLAPDHPYRALVASRLAKGAWAGYSEALLTGTAFPLSTGDSRHGTTVKLAAYLCQGRHEIPMLAKLLWPCWQEMMGHGERVGEFVRVFTWLLDNTQAGPTDPVLMVAQRTAEYGPDIETLDAKRIALEWGLGSGKTYQLERVVAGKRALIIVPLKSLAANVAARLDAVDYQTVKDKGPEYLLTCERIVVSIPALARIPYKLGKSVPWDVVCVDEVVQCLDQLFSIHVEQSVPAIRTLRDACQGARRVVFCDAHLDDVSFSSIERTLVGAPVLRHVHRGRDIFDRLALYKDDAELLAHLRGWLEAGDKCYVACTSKAQVEWVQRESAEWRLLGELRAYHSDIGSELRDDIRNPDSSWRCVQCVVTSPTIGSGVSYDPPEDIHKFDRVLLFASPVMGVGQNTLLQMTGRVRWPKDTTLHAWLSDTEYELTVDPKALEADQGVRMRLAWTLARKYGQCLADTRDVRLTDPIFYADWLYAQTEGLARCNRDGNQPAVHFIAHMRLRGVQPYEVPTVLSADLKASEKIRRRQVSETIKIERVRYIMQAQTMPIEQARRTLKLSSVNSEADIAAARKAYVEDIYGYVDEATTWAEWAGTGRFSTTMSNQATLLVEHAAGRLTLQRMIWGPLGKDNTPAAWGPLTLAVLQEAMPSLFGHKAFGMVNALEAIREHRQGVEHTSPEFQVLWAGDRRTRAEVMATIGVDTRRGLDSAVADGKVHYGGRSEGYRIDANVHIKGALVLSGSSEVQVAGGGYQWRNAIDGKGIADIKRALPPGFDHPEVDMSDRRVVHGVFKAMGLPLASRRRKTSHLSADCTLRLVWLARHVKRTHHLVGQIGAAQFGSDRMAAVYLAHKPT